MSQESVNDGVETFTGRTERALEMATSFEDVISVIETTVEGIYTDGEHSYSKDEIIAAVELAREANTPEIPVLYKVPGLQATVARLIEAG